MAEVTLSAGTCAKEPRNNHAGNYTQYFKYELNGVTLSASHRIFMGYIPQGVTVLDGWIWGLTANLATYKVGTSASISALSTAISCSAAGVVRFSGFVPRQFSISADAEGNHKVPIVVKMVACSATITGSLNMCLILAKDTPL
jgi:hypothetical protein